MTEVRTPSRRGETLSPAQSVAALFELVDGLLAARDQAVRLALATGRPLYHSVAVMIGDCLETLNTDPGGRQ